MTETGLSVGTPHYMSPELPDGVGTGPVAGDMDISPDDRRFIMVRHIPVPRQPLKLVMVENFLAEVKAKVRR
jgi:hypothetical protein